MGKQLYFYLGFFSAGLLAVPIASGIMGATEQEMRRIAVILFIAVSALVFFLVIALFFRDRILRGMFGQAEATLEDVSASLISGVSAATAGDREAATKHAQELVQRGMGWYAWTGFYRWVIATAVALLLAFGAFMGTVLLFEQNRKLGEQTEVLEKQSRTLDRQTQALEVQTERLTEQTGFMQAQTELMRAQTDRLQDQSEAAAMQNEIMTLNLVNQLRERMVATIETQTLGELFAALGLLEVQDPLATYSSSGQSCSVWFNPSHQLDSVPSPATILAIGELIESPTIGEDVVRALEFLTQDRNGGVALGALRILEGRGHPFKSAPILVNNAVIEEIYRLRSGGYEVEFRNSLVSNFNCPECRVKAQGSIYSKLYGEFLDAQDSVVLTGAAESRFKRSFYLWYRSDREIVEDQFDITLTPGPLVSQFGRETQAWLRRGVAPTVCEAFSEIVRRNPMLQMTAP